MRKFSSIFKNRLGLIILVLFLLIIAFIGVIYYLDQKSTMQPTNTTGLKGYTALEQKLKSLGKDQSIGTSNAYIRAVKRLNSLTDKNLSEKDKYQALSQAQVLLFILYSDTNNPKLYPTQKDFRDFAKENFPKLYNEKEDFLIGCVDSTCADSPQPPEILDIVNDIKSSTLSAHLQQNLTRYILNVGYMPKNAVKARGSAYLIRVELINDAFGTPYGETNPISNKLKKFIKENYPEQYKEAFETLRPKDPQEILQEKEEKNSQ